MRYHLFLNSFGKVVKVYTSYWAAQNIWPTLYSSNEKGEQCIAKTVEKKYVTFEVAKLKANFQKLWSFFKVYLISLKFKTTYAKVSSKEL